MSFVTVEYQDQIGILTIRRPEALNALNSQVVADVLEALKQVEQSDARCLIVTGEGEKAFVAGADIAEMKDLDPEGAAKFSREGNEMMEKMELLKIPTIAAVNGYALGGGCEFSLACDIRIAAENAMFSFPEVSLGIMPGYGGMQRAVRVLGVAKAKELVYTTNRLMAPEAKELGLVSAVYPLEGLMEACIKMASKIARNAPLGVQKAKQVLNGSIGLTLAEAESMESDPFGELFATKDQKNAMTAFVEKRKPEPFSGE